MKIKKGDKVKIIKGKDRSKQGKVLQVIKKNADNIHVVVEGLNLRYKHLRPKRQGEPGQKVMFPAPISLANLMLICPKCGKPSRVAFKPRQEKSEISQETKNRFCKKCNNTF